MMIDAVNIDNFQYFWKYLSGSRFEGGRRMPPYIKMQLQSLFQPSWNQKKPFQSNLSLTLQEGGGLLMPALNKNGNFNTF